MSDIAMSNETDLDWLARDVHVWPEGKCEVLVCWPRNVDTLIWSFVLSDTGWITKDQWSARRAEMQNKPSWSGSPEWAQFLGQDEDGVWYWHGERPNEKGEDVNGQRYWVSRGISDIACRGELLEDWRDTLEMRPSVIVTGCCTVKTSECVGYTVAGSDLSEQAVTARLQEATDNVLAAVPELKSDRYKFEQFTSIEDNQEQVMSQKQEMKQDNGWFERGELPPVGCLCLYVVSDRLSAEVEITAHAKFGLCFVQIGQSGESYVSKTAELHRFRPIRTEREVAIEHIQSDIAERWANCEELAKHLVDKGWVKGGK